MSRLRAQAVTGLLVAALVTLAGAPVGLVWAAVRPRLDYGAAVLEESAFDAQSTTDVRLLLLVVLLALVSGGLVAGFVLRSGRRARDGEQPGTGLGAVLGLAAGSALAVVVAGRTGVLATHPDHLVGAVDAAFRARGYTPFRQLDAKTQAAFLDQVRFGLRARTVVAAAPAVACGVVAVALLVVDQRDARPARPAPGWPPASPPWPPAGPPAQPPGQQPVSWGSAGAGSAPAPGPTAAG